MTLHPAVADRLARLAPDQRAAATAPPGPVLCVAPAGSGKTTTLIARIAWLVASGADPSSILAIAFNRRAAEEMVERLDGALEPLGTGPGAVRVKTFHALGMEILRSAGRSVEPLLARDVVLRAVRPKATPAELRALDTAISRLKLDLMVDVEAVAADDEAGPVALTFVAYERALRAASGLDFDDLVGGAIRSLEADPARLARWRSAAVQMLVDEAQDLDRSQLRLALLLAAPRNQVFLVGDDDQSIYGWRLADVRRVLGLAAELPGLRRVDLEVNYRCPAPVLARAVRLIEVNRERFVKVIRPGPVAAGRLVLAPDAGEETERVRHVLASWPSDEGTRAILARTNRELLPAAAVLLELGLPFRAVRLESPLESAFLDELLGAAAATPAGLPVLVRLGLVRDVAEAGAAAEVARADASAQPGAGDEPPPFTRTEVAAALVSWAAGFDELDAFAAAVHERRERLAELRRDDAPLTLATAHSTKGLEFDHVAVLTDGFPAKRSVAESAEPLRELEEERRLAYVAWTRARRSLTLVYDPAAPPPFLREAFSDEELAPSGTAG